MDVQIAKSIIEEILKSNNTFDSHDFIQIFIKSQPSLYGRMLTQYDNVTTAHSVIANFLLNNTNELGIERLGDDSISRDIFNKKTPCAEWMVQIK